MNTAEAMERINAGLTVTDLGQLEKPARSWLNAQVKAGRLFKGIDCKYPTPKPMYWRKTRIYEVAKGTNAGREGWFILFNGRPVNYWGMKRKKDALAEIERMKEEDQLTEAREMEIARQKAVEIEAVAVAKKAMAERRERAAQFQQAQLTLAL